MQWPPDHPVHLDAPLARWRDDADAVCPAGDVVATLRHVPGRRVATRVLVPDGPAVVKVFASPRARGNHRRLQELYPRADDLLPRPLAVGPAGHAGLVEYLPGRPLTELSGTEFVDAAERTGRVLARLHGCGARLDREWTAHDERDHLARLAARPGRAWDAPAPAAPVPAHRDLHPAQVVAEGGTIRLIDLDEATMAPPALDVGNFLAHLDRDAALGDRPTGETVRAGRAFLDGYGDQPRDLAWWRAIALARLAVLAEDRHGRPDWAVRLRALAG